MVERSSAVADGFSAGAAKLSLPQFAPRVRAQDGFGPLASREASRAASREASASTASPAGSPAPLRLTPLLAANPRGSPSPVPNSSGPTLSPMMAAGANGRLALQPDRTRSTASPLLQLAMRGGSSAPDSSLLRTPGSAADYGLSSSAAGRKLLAPVSAGSAGSGPGHRASIPGAGFPHPFARDGEGNSFGGASALGSGRRPATPLFPPGFSDLLDDPAALQELEDLLQEMTAANEEATTCSCSGGVPYALLHGDFPVELEDGDIPADICASCLAAAGTSQAAAFDMATLMGRVAAEVIARDVRIIVTSNLPADFGIGQPPALAEMSAASIKAGSQSPVQQIAARTTQTPQPERAGQLTPLPLAVHGVGEAEGISAAAVRSVAGEAKQAPQARRASESSASGIVGLATSVSPPPPAQAPLSPKLPRAAASPSQSAPAAGAASSSSPSPVRVVLSRAGSSSAFSMRNLNDGATSPSRLGAAATAAAAAGSGSTGGVVIVPALNRSPSSRMMQAPHVAPLDAALAIVASSSGSAGLPASHTMGGSSGAAGPSPPASSVTPRTSAADGGAPSRSATASPAMLATSTADGSLAAAAAQQTAVRPSPSLPPRPQAVQASVLPPARAPGGLVGPGCSSSSVASLVGSVVSAAASTVGSQVTSLGASSGGASLSTSGSVASGGISAVDKDKELRDKRAAERAAAAQAKQAAAKAEAERLKKEKAQKPKVLSPLLVEARRTAAEREVRRQEQREARRLKALEKERASEARERALMAAEEWHMERVKWAKNIGGREGGWRTVRVFISSTFSDMHGESQCSAHRRQLYGTLRSLADSPPLPRS